MEKLKIGNNTFDLVPMGISEDTIRKTRSFTVSKSMDFEAMRTAVLSGMSRIDHIGNDGTVVNTYMDCIALKTILVNEEGTYTITLSTDASLTEIKALQAKLKETQSTSDNAVAELTILIASMA
jgi:hypothetical protein